MSFPRYRKYKESGVEWLGEVPENWEVKRARAVGVFSSSGIDKKLVEGEQSVQMFNYLDVYKSTDKILRYSIELMWTTTPAEKVVEHAVAEGDILLTPSSETEDDIGHAARVSDVPKNVVFSYHLVRFRKGKLADSAYLTYSFNAALIRSYFESVCTGTTRMVLGREDFKNAPIALPPLSEQTTIAEFLDRETAKIDELVAEQRQLMELLKEKRQAVISRAVTHGPNPDAPMKPSGIEWLGDVPAHWSIVPLKRVLEVKDGTHATPPYVDPADDTFPLVTSKDFGETSICFDETKHISAEDHFEVIKRSNTERGDVLMSMIGGNIGKALIVETDREFSIKNVALFKTRRSECLAKYLLYYFQSGLLDIQIDLLSRGGAQGFLGLGDIRNLVFFKMPLDEMHLLVQDLESQLAPYSELNKAAEECLLLMQERRSALISAAVTGKIDVRGLVASSAISVEASCV